MSTSPATQVEAPLDLILKANHYLHGCISDWWGEFGKRGRGLRFTESGLARVSHIFGFISALSMFQKELAEDLATQIVKKLDGLATYGGELEIPMSGEKQPLAVPTYIVELSDDGTWGGFSILWHVALTEDRWAATPGAGGEGKLVTRFAQHFPHCLYVKHAFSFNGGLLFHGFHDGFGSGGAPTYAVELGGSAGPHWSIHT